MKIEHFEHLNGVSLITLPKFGDERGYFTAFPQFTDVLQGPVVQMNTSMSNKGVLRGMHHQVTKQQGKLVSCINGAVLDMIYDYRKDSPTYGKMDLFLLDSPNKFLHVPRGYLHGFIALEDNSIFQYFIDNPYDPSDEETVSWKIMDDRIPWDLLDEKYGIKKDNLIISDKDNI